MATDATWAALADPHRRAVLGALAERAHGVGELVERLGLSQPQASKHLRVLRDAGLVRVERRAQRRIYSVDPAPMVELDAWLQPYRALWNDRLTRLGEHLDTTGPAAGVVRAGTTEDAKPRATTTTEGRAR